MHDADQIFQQSPKTFCNLEFLKEMAYKLSSRDNSNWF